LSNSQLHLCLPVNVVSFLSAPYPASQAHDAREIRKSGYAAIR
jgi:hypothetical protein